MKRLFNQFSRENSVRGASLILIITLAISNILGLLRDRFLAKNISTYYLDTYYASFRIPDLIFNFLILGAITSAFIPVFSDFLANKEEKKAWRITNELVNLAVVTMIGFGVLLYFLMPYLIPLLVPGFAQDRLNETIKYSRLLMVTPVFFSISYIMGGVLNSYRRFFAYSLAPLFYNTSIIVGALWVAPRYGVLGVVYSVIVGSFLHLLIQVIPVVRMGYRYKAIISFKDTAIKKILTLMIPRTISMGANQVMLVVYTAIASALTAGSISAFTYANNIETVPVVVLGTSFATAVFPTLASKISSGDKSAFAFYLNRSVRTIGYVLIPTSILMILLRAHIVRLILGSGKFNWQDTRMTALALGFFAFSILAQGLIPLLAKAFYALKDTKTPMYISIATVATSSLIAYPLSQQFSVAGLALAFSIGSYFNAIALIYYLKKIYSEIFDTSFIASFFRTLSISVVAGGFVWAGLHLFSSMVDMTRFWGVLTQAILSSVIGLAIFLLLSRLFDQEELRWAVTRRINEKDV
ncbi:MAG TPA: murein biosynthesis integral membrane protein MurJ [bacterium]|nr:murein biosynthesis integral membrane protein MurJ [bacterium]